MINTFKKYSTKVPGILFGIIAVMIFFGLMSNAFLTIRNFQNILSNTAILLIVGIGMTMTILAGKLDLSVAGIMSFAGILAAMYLKSIEDPGVVHIIAAILIAAIAGACIGTLNGILIGGFKYNHWLVTFATMSIGFGLTKAVNNGQQVAGFNKAVRYLGDGRFLGVNVLLIATLIILVVMMLYIRNSRFGTHIYCVGDSAQCAEQSGVNVSKILFYVYLISGILAGIGGFLFLSKTNSISPTTCTNYEFNAIAAVIVGGTSFGGGRGGIIRTVYGTLFITIIRNGVLFIGLNNYQQTVVVGVVILFIIVLDIINEKRKKVQLLRRRYLDE